MRAIKFRVYDSSLSGYTKNTMEMEGGGVYSPYGHGYRYIFEQFTGLSDRSGKDIYEGDIVEVGAFPRLVFWDDGGWAVKQGICFTGDAARHCKVIGNINQDREILGDIIHGVAGSHYVCRLSCRDLLGDRK